MKLQYEVGDVVWTEYGIEAGVVVKISKRGTTVENDDGERFFIGKRHVEPVFRTLRDAEWL